MSIPSSASRLAVVVAVVQFFFATTWTLYIIYLPQLAAQAGIGKEWIPWILVADQVVFAVTDVITGFWVDRVRRGLARMGGWILAITVVSAVGFLALPFAGGSATVLLVAVFVWAITSSALRSPPWALLSRHAATPAVPWLAAIVLTGSALAAAAAPYLGLALKGVDPRLPFVVSTLTLVVTVAVLVLAEKNHEEEKPAEEKAAEPPSLLFFVALLFMAIGFQVHFALNSAPQYLRVATAAELPYLMPVFWVGFNLGMFPFSLAVKRLGAAPAMALAAAAGALAILCAALASGLASLVIAQLAAGAFWGAASVAAYTGAIGFGRTGREGRYLGLLFAMLALAAFVRIAAYASDLVADPQVKAWLPWIPQAAWLAAGLILSARFFRRA
ncbi:MAG TPA: MFS transporter [Burkholderiales bacterium]|nr:MFS transporter [Burkholderiales bacterium]